jgi:hypothetical protein
LIIDYFKMLTYLDEDYSKNLADMGTIRREGLVSISLIYIKVYFRLTERGKQSENLRSKVEELGAAFEPPRPAFGREPIYKNGIKIICN